MRGKRKTKSKFFNTALLFILPGLAGFTLFYIWPFFISMRYAFLDKAVNGTFIGLKNYIDLLTNKPYLRGLLNTVIFIGIGVPLNIVLSLSVALLINRLKKHKELFILFFLIPLVIPSGSMVFFWKMMFATNGYVNHLLQYMGMAKINWLETEMARTVIILIFVWKNLGYNMVLFLSGLHNIPSEYYEAARVDGAGPLQAFRSITVVCLLPTSVLVLIMSVINSFKIFKEIYLITGSYPHESIYTLQHFMNNMFQSLNYQKLSTATSVLVLLMTILTQFLFKLERKVSLQ